MSWNYVLPYIRGIVYTSLQPYKTLDDTLRFPTVHSLPSLAARAACTMGWLWDIEGKNIHPLNPLWTSDNLTCQRVARFVGLLLYWLLMSGLRPEVLETLRAHLSLPPRAHVQSHIRGRHTPLSPTITPRLALLPSAWVTRRYFSQCVRQLLQTWFCMWVPHLRGGACHIKCVGYKYYL